MRNFIIIFLLLFVISIKTNAQITDQNERIATASFISELSECAIFYSILGQGTDSTGNQWKGGEKFLKLSEKISIKIFNLAEKINMKHETVFAMMTDFSKKMGNEIGHDAINIRILLNKHGKFCKMIVENPRERLNFWLSK